MRRFNDYAVSGCAEIRMPNRDTYTSGCAYINFAAALEMTMYGGRMQKYGDEVIGLDTGDPTKFTEWDQFYDSYKAQHLNFIKHAFIQQKTIIDLKGPSTSRRLWAPPCTTCAWRTASTCISPTSRAASTWATSSASATAP